MMKSMRKWLAVLLGALLILPAAGIAEMVNPANELTYVESVEYKGNGIFEIEFMRHVAWRTDFVLTGTDEAGKALVVTALGGDADEMFVQVDGTVADNALLTFRLVGDSGVISAVGQASLNFKYANHCEHCLEFGHAEKTCPVRIDSNARENDRCDECGQLGHDDDYCPERVSGTQYCDECGQSGHDDDHCAYDDDDCYDFCDYCGLLGHDDDHCPSRISVTPANNVPAAAANTGSTNAASAVSATPLPEYCDDCRQYGHDDDHCPNEYCKRCGQYGHDDDYCPTRTCKRCGESGHSGDDCPQKRCDECGEAGHDDDHCPNERCDECGEVGHDDDHCPNERCDECGEAGHDDDHCPNERCDDCGEAGHDDDHCPNRKHHGGKHHD